jgi:hypothetical protein
MPGQLDPLLVDRDRIVEARQAREGIASAERRAVERGELEPAGERAGRRVRVHRPRHPEGGLGAMHHRSTLAECTHRDSSPTAEPRPTGRR